MTQENEDLLLKDLCARLPYRVICQCDKIKIQGVLKEIGMNYNMCRLYDRFTDEYENCYIFDCKPYLFPISSMTKEQEMELDKLNPEFYSLICEDGSRYVSMDGNTFDWFNANHFDWRGLIPMGLAIDATGLNIY